MGKTELMVETLKLEGDRWRLYKRIDNCWSIYEYPKLQAELYHLNLKIESNIELIRSMGGRYAT